MRQVVLDTETTGLEPEQGHRIIEIGAVELIDRRRTQNHYHVYLQPDREVDDGAVEVHGITNEFLADKPRFADVVDSFVEFIAGAELVIHNAPFDVGFLDYELKLLGPAWGAVAGHATVLDTLELARRLHPGQRNSLDALCKRYEIDNAHRQWHGALLDAEILAEVYLAMTGGQAALLLEGEQQRSSGPAEPQIKRVASSRGPLKVIRANEQELAAHDRRLQAIDEASGGQCLWRQLESD